MAATACANGEPAKVTGRDRGRERARESKAGAVTAEAGKKERPAVGLSKAVASADRAGSEDCVGGPPSSTLLQRPVSGNGLDTEGMSLGGSRPTEGVRDRISQRLT